MAKPILSSSRPTSSRPGVAIFAVAFLAVSAAPATLRQIPDVLHQAVDLRRAERWSRGNRADQAAFLLTMLHHARPGSARITLALVRAQQRSGDGAAMEKTLGQLQVRDWRAADRVRRELSHIGNLERDPPEGR